MLDTYEPETEEKDSGATAWNRIVGASLAMPGAKVDRESFLRSQLMGYCEEEQIAKAIKDSPANAGISPELIDKLADACIKWQRYKASAISFATGIPGGWAMAGTLPADLVQFYWHAIVLAQQLAYLYGWPSILEDGEVDEETKLKITLLVGAMLGAAEAQKAIAEIAKRISEQMVRRLPRIALTKTAFYPVIKQIGRWIGINITKNTFARGAARIVPILGGFISGGLTSYMIKKMANRLKDHLKKTIFAQPRK